MRSSCAAIPTPPLKRTAVRRQPRAAASVLDTVLDVRENSGCSECSGCFPMFRAFRKFATFAMFPKFPMFAVFAIFPMFAMFAMFPMFMLVVAAGCKLVRGGLSLSIRP